MYISQRHTHTAGESVMVILILQTGTTQKL